MPAVALEPAALKTGCRLAAAAKAAYAGTVGPQPKLDPLSDPDFAGLGWPAAEVFHGPRTDTHLFLAEGPKDLALVFRGSLTLPNWLVNVSFDLTPCDPARPGCGQVHAGFAAAWAEVREAVLAKAAAAACEGKPLLLAGHSLGGALAVLAAAELTARGIPVAAVHTFGAPRPGDAAFAAAWTVPTERWVNHQDPVPLLPWSGFFSAGYQHVGRLNYLSAAGEVATDASLWGRFRDQLSGLTSVPGANLQAKFAELLRARIADHDIGAYLAKLRKLAGA